LRYAKLLVSDILSPGAEDWFPKLRHIDLYEGHSWASGLFKMFDGREQESCSEAVNAYYSIALLGRLMKDNDMENTAKVCLALEIQASRTYWQVPGLAVETYPKLFAGGLYSPVFSKNMVVGVMGGNMVSHTTWFGTNVEFVHGIQMIPFTGISNHLFPKPFVTREYGQLAMSLSRRDPAIMPSWEGYVRMAQAIIDPVGAWNGISGLNASEFDDGNSITNALYWTATQPLPENQDPNEAFVQFNIRH